MQTPVVDGLVSLQPAKSLKAYTISDSDLLIQMPKENVPYIYHIVQLKRL